MQAPTKWLYTVEEVMEIFGVSRSTLWQWRELGRLKPVKGVTKRLQYLAQEVEELKIHVLEFSGKYEYIPKDEKSPN